MIDNTEKFDRPISRWLTRCLIALVANGCIQAAAQTLIWSEEFDTGSVPDSSVWTYETGAGGWGNQELQNYTSSTNNVRVEGGNLIITAVRSGNNFTSGRIKTQNKLTFKYGTVEARIKTPNLANGLWPAFWTLGADYPTVGWPDCGEIDIMEMGSKEAIDGNIINRWVKSTAHWDNFGAYAAYGTRRIMTSDINDTFVTYRMEWTPGSITTYINDLQIWSMDINSYSNPDKTEFHAPHFFILNMAVGGTFPDIYNASGISALPVSGASAEYVIDYIRIYDNGSTVMGGSAAPNIPPVFTTDPIIKSNALEDSVYFGNITGSATDANPGDTLSYYKDSGPAWLNVGVGGVIAGLPGEADVGTNSWTVLVDDGNGGTDTATLKITVDKLNDPPVFNENPIIRPNAIEGSGYIRTIGGSATDEDPGDTLTYSKVSGPAWLNVTPFGVISGVPGSADVGLNSWTIQVTDGINDPVTAELQITVESTSPPPPSMSIQVSGSNLEILWPASATGYSLYGTANLSPPVAWSSVTNTPIIQGDDWIVTMPLIEAPQFFRLENP